MVYLLAAALSSILYAIADNINGFLSRKNTALQLSLWASVVSIVLLTPLAFTVFLSDFAKLSGVTIVPLLLISLIQPLGGIFFLMGMRTGSVMLTGVIGGSFPLITVLLAYGLFGERLTPVQIAATLLVLIGIILASATQVPTKLSKHKVATGTLYAIGACVAWGVYFALVRIPVQQVGWYTTQLVSPLIGMVITAAIATWFVKDKKIFKRPKPFVLVIVTALAVTLASLAYNYAITGSKTSLVAPIAGSSPALFAVIAYLVFREKLQKHQWLGVVLTVVGVVGLSAGF